jgi:hypothetical protein
MGAAVGSIIATIMTTHITRNSNASRPHAVGEAIGIFMLTS